MRLGSVAFLLFFGACVTSAWCQCLQGHLVQPNAKDFEHYGSGAAIDGDVAVIATTPPTNDGSAWVYRRIDSEWKGEEQLSPFPNSSTTFGASAAVSGNVIVVGAPLENCEQGAVYVYRFNGSIWSEEQRITAPTPTPIQFGTSVAIWGEIIAVGAPRDDQAGPDAGAVYIFRHNGTLWELEATLVPHDADENDSFGASVDVNGSFVVAGSNNSLDGKIRSGSAYVFHFDGTDWLFQWKLLASDSVAYNEFRRVAIDGDVITVGASRDNPDDPDPGPGAVYVFKFTGEDPPWTQVQKLLATDGEVNDFFGTWVDVSGDGILVGATGDDDGGSESGAAYYFCRNEKSGMWDEISKLVPPNPAPGDKAGRWVSLSGRTALVSAFLDDHSGLTEAGSAYLWVVGREIAAWSNYGSGCAGTNGVPAFTASAPPVLGSCLTLNVENSLGVHTTGFLFIGFAKAKIPLLDCFLLVQPSIVLAVPLPGGGLVLPVCIPCDSLLLEIQCLYTQVLELDPGASKSISFTRGVQLDIGF